MKRMAIAAGVGLLLSIGWMAATAVLGGQPSAAPAAPTQSEEKPVAAAAAPTASTATASAPAAPARGPQAPQAVTPPAPLPEVEIPPIPEVDKDPFRPGLPPVQRKPSDVIQEGKRLFEREGRLSVDPLGRSFFVFDSGDKPMQLLENSFREKIESATERGAKQARWRISGIVTVYEGKNYLLLTRVTRILPEEENL